MNSKNHKTLTAIFTDPVRSNIKWVDIEVLLIGFGAEMREGAGSRVKP